ncbi:MAG: O-Antigen ligase [Deltaproteobacteria bacterium]|nr:O-Antigen ligase [Deltaproteobacteria bacterium]
MRKATPATPKPIPPPPEPSFNPYFVIACILTLVVPILVLPAILDNAFNTPKTVLMQLGVCLMAAVYSIQLFRGKEVSITRTAVPKLMMFVILLNFFSFFYTRNYYYTNVAVTMNVAALLFLYFLSLHLSGRTAFWLLVLTALSGVLVSIETWFEFYDKSVLFTWLTPGSMVVGTIGNSNYLGAYLLFPLLAFTALIFLLKEKLRWVAAALWIFVFAALLFSRARAAWVGVAVAVPGFIYSVMRIYRFSPMAYIRSRVKRAALFGVSGLVLIGLLWALAPQRFHVMMGFSNVTNPTTFILRTQKYFQASWWLFKESPLFGTGLWSYRNLVYDAQAELERVERDFFKGYAEPKPRRVHNEYLETLNDGGLLAGLVLLIFVGVVLKHGLAVIRKEDVPLQERIIASAAFYSLVGILAVALFFFPFRLNSTLFMTVLMMGITEGLYLRHSGLIEKLRPAIPGARYALLSVVLLLLIGWLYYSGYKPIKGELEHLGYKKAMAMGMFKEAEKHIVKALEYDPDNTLYCLYAAQLYMGPSKDLAKARDLLERAVHLFNGDATKWSLYYLKGQLAFQTGAIMESKAALEKSLQYNPLYTEAKQKLDEVNKVIQEHDRVMIKFK